MLIETDEVPCSTCRSFDADEVGRSRDFEFSSCTNEFVFVRCRHCGLTYLRNRPTARMLGVIYPPEYYRYAEFLGPVTTAARGVVQGSRVRLMSRVAGEGAVIMEVGCGEGQLLQALKASGRSSWRIVGIDFSDDACAALRRQGLEMHAALFEQLEWPAASVDVIVMNQVIEHVADPRAFIRKAASLLRPGGRLWIETPSVGAWDQRWVAPDNWGGWHCPRHWSLYDAPSLTALLAEEGLRTERQQYLLSPFIWAHTTQNVVRTRKALRWASRFLSERSLPALATYASLDFVQLIVSGRTSNMRLIATRQA